MPISSAMGEMVHEARGESESACAAPAPAAQGVVCYAGADSCVDATLRALEAR